MYRSKVIQMNQIRLQDLLTVDLHGSVIRIQDKFAPTSYSLIPDRSVFFNDLFAEVRKNSVVLIGENEKKEKNLGNILNFLDESQNSCVVLLEGFAGCGKSTLVQYILWKQLNTFNFEYNLFNYDLEAQNDIIIHDNNGDIIRQSSIFEAIKKSFIEQFIVVAKKSQKAITDFGSLLKESKKFQPFNDLYYKFFNTNTFEEVLAYVKENISNSEETVEKILSDQLGVIRSSTCILALDYFLRLAMYKNRMIEKLYICYDNLDAIEDADDLKNFDDKLIASCRFLDDFIIKMQDRNFFEGLSTPHFVIIATYRKITARIANISEEAYREVRIDELYQRQGDKRVLHIDVTSTFSYKKIVEKRKDYFQKVLENASNISVERKKKLIRNFNSWNMLNQNLEIMKDRYACLWNKNYRTCSIIADEFYSIPRYRFTDIIDFLNKSEIDDGYNNNENNDSVLCSYYGKSAILLSIVCKVFNDNHIWDNLLELAPLNTESHSYKYVSLSRIILTYIYNKNSAVSLNELFNIFCKDNFFSHQSLCRILSKMLARNRNGVWRRPIYYAKEFIFSERADEIEKTLLKECEQLSLGNSPSSKFEFLLCESGASYVERLMQEFEFFSNRLSNQNQPLYLYKDLSKIKEIIASVCNAVLHCCKNMLDFRVKYIDLHKITDEEYLSLPIHPVTNSHSSQLHTERTIFSHISYLNKVRLYFINSNINPDLEVRKKYNNEFVGFIKKYLSIYYDFIFPLTSIRSHIADKLKEKVNEIQAESKKRNSNVDILFQSISL